MYLLLLRCRRNEIPSVRYQPYSQAAPFHLFSFILYYCCVSFKIQ